MAEQKIISTGTRDTVIDALRTAAILAVILIHTSSRTIESVYMNLPQVSWGLFLNQVSRFAVPLFFLISGFVLELSHSDDIGYLSYLKKRISKIVLPYVFWSFVYYYFVYTRHSMGFLTTLIGGNSSYQLYFIPPLMLLYLIYPLFHMGYRWISKWWVILILTMMQLWLLYLDYYPRSISMFDPLRITLLNYLYFVLGMIFCQHTEQIKALVQKAKYLWILIPAALAGYVYYEGYSRYLSSWNYVDFYSQWRPSIFFYTLSLFCGGYYWLNKLNSKYDILSKLANYSFFVFFVHVVILEKVWIIFKDYLFRESMSVTVRQLWFDPAFFAITAVISFFIAYISHKIPWLSKLTG
jgi:probable poly-beta-1,6-N-acetyl-D-glucosamine export protein